MIRMGWIVGASALVLAACGGSESDAPASDTAVAPPIAEITVGAEGDFQTALLTALIEAPEGQTINLPEGAFELTTGLSLDVDGVTLLGAGQDKTVLSFAGQTGAGEGLLVTSDDVTLAGFTLQDTKGDGIKSKGADRIVYRDLTVEWTGGPDEGNGAYGVYPVESTDVLVERVTVRGASDAGIYVGQSRNIIVRDSLAEYNVAGVEIENSIGADVYGNTMRHNAGGMLVFDLPDLPMVGGHSTRIFNNEIVDNNTRNFAPPGNIVANVPSGTGVIIMANENVHVFENQIRNNRTAGVLVTAYQDPFADENYNPLPRNVVLRANAYENNGYEPQGVLGDLSALMGGALPPVIWDGVDRWGEGEAVDVNLAVMEAEDVGFINLGFGAYPLDPAALAPSPTRPDAEAKAEPDPITLAHDGA
ncbi:MAG: parallel beta-helix domain-containing protein [Pseudomonadota bacterium]